MAGLEEVKQAGKNINENLDQNIIDKDEIINTQKDVDLLKKEKDNAPEKEVKVAKKKGEEVKNTKEDRKKELTAEEKVGTEALKIWNRYSDALKDAIIAYFKPEKADKDGKKIPDISKQDLTPELITNYIKTLTALKRENTENAENAENKKDAENTERNTRIDAIIKALENKGGDITRTENEKKTNTLLDMLNSDPTVNSKEKTEALFENNPSMRESIFTNKDKLSDQQKENLNQFLQIYSGCTKTEDGKWTYRGGTVDMTTFSYTITESAGNLNYKTGEKYIQISFDVKSEENKVEKTTKITKDIMFGKEVKVIEEARANKSIESNTAKIATDKKLTITNIGEMQEAGSYQYLRKLVVADKVDLTKSLEGDLLKNIKDYYAGKADGKDKDLNIENKEDGYYTTIAELVVTKAKAGDLEPMKEYLKHVNKDNLQYLGRNKAEQEKNMKILLSAGDENPGYKQEQWKDINTALQDMNMQIFPTQDILTQAKNGLKGIFDQYGENLIKFLNRIGIGKSFLYKICKAVGIDFKEVDEYYTKAYGLSKEATEASDEIVAKYTDKKYDWDMKADDKGAMTIPIKPTDAATLQTSFEKKIGKDFLKDETDQNKFIGNMNPQLLSNLIDTYNTNHPKSEINKQNVLITTTDKNKKQKLNIRKGGAETIEADKKTAIIKLITEDQNTRNTIREANRKIDGYIPNKKDADPTRSDLGSNRSKFTINQPSDMVKYLNYYAFSGKTGDLDYVITETKKVPEKIETPVEKKYTVIKEVKFRPEADPKKDDRTTFKVGEEITSIIEGGKEIERTGKDLKLEDKDLENQNYIKIKRGEIIGYVAKDGFLEEKKTQEEVKTGEVKT